MPDQGDGRQFVYHAKEASRWSSPTPLLDRYRYFQRQGAFPNNRWTGSDTDGLYTAHDEDVAFAEVAQYYRASSLLGSDLADTGHKALIVVAKMRPLESPAIWDGRTQGFLRDPRAGACLLPRPAGHAAGRAFARPLIGAGNSRLVLPSAPFFRAGDVRWNSVFIIGDRHIPAERLPRLADVSLGRPRTA